MNIESDNEDILEEDVLAAAMEVADKEDGAAPPEAGSSETKAAAKLQPEAPAEEAPEAPAERVLTEDKAPRGWSPGAREKWSTIPEDLRQEILRREDASIQGVRQLQEKYAPMEGFVRSMAPLLQEAHQHGVMADQYIGQVMGTERILRTADVPTRFQAILAIADQYGVPLRDIINESVGQKVIPPPQPQQQMQLPPQLIQEINEMRAWRQQFEGQATNQQIAAFAQDKEFFGDVNMMMANLIDSGAAQTLDEAYDQACWANPQIREILMNRNTQQGRRSAAAGASIRPGTSAGITVSEAEESDDLENTVRSAFARSTSGRL